MLQNVSVIGGGLGGLAFAQGMRAIAGYKVTVFERDPAQQARSQGYQIGLNEAGIGALRSIKFPWLDGLLNENPLDGFMMVDSTLDPLIKFGISNSKQFNKSSLVNRWKLRDFLTQGLDIQYGKKFVGYEEFNDKVVAHFDDGTTAESALLIGADGSNSKVRAQYRPDLELVKSGCSSIAGYFKLNVDVHDELKLMKTYIMQGNLGRAILSDSHSMLFMKFIDSDGDVNLLWSLSYQTDIAKNLYGDLSTDIPEMKQQFVQRLTNSNCNVELLKLFDMTPNENFEVPRAGVMMKHIKDPHVRPSTLSPHKYRVLLLGDAAHAMTTHAGRGANTAFNDAIQLCNILQDQNNNLFSKNWIKGHELYEKMMFANGFQAMQDSFSNTERIHKVDNKGGIRFMRGIGTVMKSWNYITKGKFSLI